MSSSSRSLNGILKRGSLFAIHRDDDDTHTNFTYEEGPDNKSWLCRHCLISNFEKEEDATHHEKTCSLRNGALRDIMNIRLKDEIEDIMGKKHTDDMTSKHGKRKRIKRMIPFQRSSSFFDTKNNNNSASPMKKAVRSLINKSTKKSIGNMWKKRKLRRRRGSGESTDGSSSAYSSISNVSSMRDFDRGKAFNSSKSCGDASLSTKSTASKFCTRSLSLIEEMEGPRRHLQILDDLADYASTSFYEEVGEQENESHSKPLTKSTSDENSNTDSSYLSRPVSQLSRLEENKGRGRTSSDSIDRKTRDVTPEGLRHQCTLEELRKVIRVRKRYSPSEAVKKVIDIHINVAPNILRSPHAWYYSAVFSFVLPDYYSSYVNRMMEKFRQELGILD